MPQPAEATRDISTHDLPVQVRAAELIPATFNEADNTVDVVWTVGARVRRYDWWTDTPYEEELLVEPEAVDMTRFEAGTVQVLDGHRTYGGVEAILGIAQRGWLEGGEGRATLRLSTRPELAGVVADIRAGIIRAISFGYSVQRYEITRAQDRTDGVNLALYRATLWTPQEISFVTVPADANASTRAQPSQASQAGRSTGMPCEFVRAVAHSTQESLMPNQANALPGGNAAQEEQNRQAAPATGAPAADAAAQAQREATAAEQARAGDITELCTRHNVAHLAVGMIRAGNTVEQARAAVLEELARRDATGGGHLNVQIQTISDEHETRMAGMEEAIQHRVDAGVKLTDNGRQYRGMTIIELGRDMLERAGQSTRGLTRMDIATRMLQLRSSAYMGTSDFAHLMSNVAGKRLRAAYEQAESTYQVWARRAPNAPDFKDMNVLQMSGAPELLRTNEHGEFTYGTISDGAEVYRVVTYGRIVGFTRAAMVNDDLRAFDRMIGAFGDSASRLENRLVYAQLTGNPAMSDSKALFHAEHKNLATTGSALTSIDALGAGRKDMRRQKGMQGESLNLAPRFLIVPTSLEQQAYQYTSSQYTPTTPGQVNEFRAGGRTALEPVVEPLLDEASETAWYLAANSAQVDTVEYAYLDGAEGPVVDSQVGFEIDGVSVRARLDFGAKVVDYRGLRKATGQS